jgi:hypothetical protein
MNWIRVGTWVKKKLRVELSCLTCAGYWGMSDLLPYLPTKAGGQGNLLNCRIVLTIKPICYFTISIFAL